METLVELVAKIKADSTDLEKGLKDAEKQTEASSKNMAESLKKIGTAMMIAGAAITASMGLMAKSAIDEEINIKRLATTLGNVGVAYDDVKDSLEEVIATTQRKTGVADDKQRDILNRLILVTNDYKKALSLLPTALDLAAAGSMDATTAATYLGKAYLELEDGAKEVSVRFGQASLKFKDMEDIQNRVRGAAENLVNPLDVLKASMGDVAEAIGAFLVPKIKEAVNKIVDIAEKVQTWTKEHPELTKTIVLTTTVIGGLLTVVGSLILIIPKIVAGIKTFQVAMVAMRAASIGVYSALGPVGLALAAISLTVAVLLPKWMSLANGIEKTTDNTYKLTDAAIKYERITGTLKASIGGWIPTEPYDKVQEAAREATEKQIENFKKLTTEAKRRATESANAQIAGIDKVISKETSAHSLKLSNLASEYNALVKNINAELGIVLDGYQSQIDAIDKQTSEEDLILTKQAEQKRLAELVAAGDYQAYKEYETEVNRNELLRRREDEKNKLRETMALARKDAEEKLALAESNYENSKLFLDKTHTALIEKLELDKSVLEDALNYKLELYDKDLAAFDENLKLQLASMSDFVKEYNALLAEMGRVAPIESPNIHTTGGKKKEEDWGVIPSFASGGIVPGSIGQPQLAMVHGGETIIPANESMGNISINFTQPVFFDREDTMNRFVDMIRKGIQRQDRLRFGGAYNG